VPGGSHRADPGRSGVPQGFAGGQRPGTRSLAAPAGCADVREGTERRPTRRVRNRDAKRATQAVAGAARRLESSRRPRPSGRLRTAESMAGWRGKAAQAAASAPASSRRRAAPTR
jgi:hypothetical protein